MNQPDYGRIKSMKNSLWFALVLCVSVSIALSAESQSPAGNILPKKTVFVPWEITNDLGWAKSGQEYVCLAKTETGYNVLISTDGRNDVAFVPFRDEWGHVTADTSDNDLVLPNNTIRIKTPIKLGSGYILLKEGSRYPVSSVEKDDYIVNYEVQGFSAKITVKQSDVVFEPALAEQIKPVEPAIQVQAAEAPKKGEEPKSVEEATAPEEEKVAAEQAVAVATPEKIEEKVTQPEKPVAPARTTETMSDVDRIKHVAFGAKVTVSSTHKVEEGEGAPEALVDGDLRTRWSSEYSEPQEIIVELAEPKKLAKLRLHWEVAAAVNCKIHISADGQAWTEAAAVTDGKIGPRVDELDMKGVSAKFIKLELLNRVHPTWGFSLYEIEAIAQ